MKKRNIHALIVCFAVIIMMIACSEKKFEKRGWTMKTDPNFSPSERGEMLSDLLSNYKLVGLKYVDVIPLFGAPDDVDSNSVSYEKKSIMVRISIRFTEKTCIFTTKFNNYSYEIKEWKDERVKKI